MPIYSVTLDRGLVRRDSLDRYLAADAADGQNLRAKPGDLVYNTMRMWQGAVGMATEDCMVSPAYVVLTPKKGISSAFFDQWFKNSHMRHLLGAYSQGITDDRLRLYPDDFAQIPVHLPTPLEQKRIVEALAAVDNKIARLRDKRDTLARFKTGTMDRLFRREVRFCRDDGSAFRDWRSKPLIEVAPNPDYGLNSAAAPYDGKHGYVRITDIDERTRAFLRSGITSPSQKPENALRLTTGDILFARTGASTGKSYLYREEDGELYHAGFLIRFRVRMADARFIFYQTLTPRFRDHIRLMSARSGQPGMNAAEIGSYELDLPEIDEQKKIADALASVDAKIGAVDAQIERMETFRSGLIQGLFP